MLEIFFGKDKSDSSNEKTKEMASSRSEKKADTFSKSFKAQRDDLKSRVEGSDKVDSFFSWWK